MVSRAHKHMHKSACAYTHTYCIHSTKIHYTHTYTFNFKKCFHKYRTEGNDLVEGGLRSLTVQGKTAFIVP